MRLEMRTPPDTITVRALAAGINSPLRTNRSEAHEGKTILQVAQSVADRNGLDLVDGTVSSKRIVFDVKDERAACEAAAKDIQTALDRYTAQDFTWLLNNGTEMADRNYRALITAAESLIIKGRDADGTEIRQTVTAWRRAVTYNVTEYLKDATVYSTRFRDRLLAIASTLNSVDKTVTRTKLDVQIGTMVQEDENRSGIPEASGGQVRGVVQRPWIPAGFHKPI